MREYSLEIEETFLRLGTSFWGIFYVGLRKILEVLSYFARKVETSRWVTSICAKKHYTTLYGNKTSAFLKARILRAVVAKAAKAHREKLSSFIFVAFCTSATADKMRIRN